MLNKQKSGIQLDIDVGHIIESPCRQCPMRNRLPVCAENCRTLHRLQLMLMDAVTCTKRVPEGEGYTVLMPNS